MTGGSNSPEKGRPGHGVSLRGTIAAVLVATICAAAACVVDQYHSAATASYPAVSSGGPALSFDARFSADLSPAPALSDQLRTSQAQSLSARLEAELRKAKNRLAQDLLSDNWRTALFDKPASSPPPPSPVAAIPLPRSRPVQASLETHDNVVADRVAPPEDHSFLQRLSDLLPGGVKLASLELDGGLLRPGPNPASLGFGNLTAVYDLSARALYMPDGSKLEAHSGLGNLMDDPGHVDVRNLGATPPNVYDLKPRERLFHGVQALRMIPVSKNETFGRSGLLAHPYMLGPNGDSNGCVSIKSYETFLKAFQNGSVKRIVVVKSVKDDLSTLQALASQS